MLFRRQVNFFTTSRLIAAAALCILTVSSCTIPRNYQRGKPFVYSSSVVLNKAGLSTSARQQLRDGLTNQLDDSLKVRTVLAVRALPPFFYTRLLRPAVFDTSYIDRSKIFMSALLNSKGYFNPLISDTFTIDTVRDQQRVNVKFIVSPGNALLYDSIGYEFTTPEFQQLALATRDRSLIEKGDAYSVQALSNELDRLLNLYRNNGYYKITKEDLYVEHDTVVAALIDPSLDPFEQFQLLDSLSRKQREPTINVVFKQRAPKDSTHLYKYQWGNVSVYPDRLFLTDSNVRPADTVRYKGYLFFPHTRKFKIPFLARNIAIRPGTLYEQSDYFRTVNTFNNLGAWQQVDLNIRERPDTSKLLDADLLLYPAKKQSLNVNFEASRNINDPLTSSSLFGFGLNLGVRNRNNFHESVASATNLRLGLELGPGIVQTLQASLSHNIYVPRFITPFRIRGEENLISPRTVINLTAEYTDRRGLFQVRPRFNASWGYDWTKRKNNWQYIPFNLEFLKVNKQRAWLDLEEAIPSLQLAFNNGLIISQILGVSRGNNWGTSSNLMRARLEESGAIAGLFKTLDSGELRRFVKLDLEYQHFLTNPHSTWAFRAFAGYGYVYGGDASPEAENRKETSLPFFKAYFGGGPYSMRAWPVRQLGLGSAGIFFDTLGVDRDTSARVDRIPVDRFGNVKLEANVEYRFDLGTIWGVKLKSAVFTDIGNVWGRTTTSDRRRLDSAEFRFDRLYNDLAIGAGTSLRFDFDFFLIRLDWAYRIKDPAYSTDNAGWFHKLQIKDGQFQLGIGYPF